MNNSRDVKHKARILLELTNIEQRKLKSEDELNDRLIGYGIDLCRRKIEIAKRYACLKKMEYKCYDDIGPPYRTKQTGLEL